MDRRPQRTMRWCPVVDPTPSGPDEEVLVIRLEGLGSFALPIATLEAHRLPAPDPAGETAAVDAVPTILRQDFLRGVARPQDLAVDRFGGIHTTGGRPVFGDPG